MRTTNLDDKPTDSAKVDRKYLYKDMKHKTFDVND